MVLELLFLFLLVVGLTALFYRSAVHEFQILQKDYDEENNWSELLSEELPLVVRGVPKSWHGAWNEKATAKKTWQVQIKQGGRRYKTTWNNWLTTADPKPQPVNYKEIAIAARLSHNLENMTADGFKRWSWLPPATPHPYVYGDGDVYGVQKSTAEFTAIVATDGAPLEIWLAHEGAIPANVSADLEGKDPWIQTTETIPWIGEVKYVEMKLRPGNAVFIPKHWWVGLRKASGSSGASWFWTAHFHTPISWTASRFQKETDQK